MADNPKQDILIQPGWSFFIDGLGFQMLSIGGLPEIDKENRRIVKFTLLVDDKVRKRYDLRLGRELDSNGAFPLTVLEDDLIPLNIYDDANRKWLYVKTLKGDETSLSNREKNIKLKLVEKEKRALVLEAENMRLNEQLNLAKTNPAKFISQYSEVFETAMKSMGNVMGNQNQGGQNK